MFLAREKELGELKSQLKSESRTAILVYGKRRIGKSTLIQQAAKDFDGIVVNFLCVKSTFDGNISLLTRSICEALNLPEMSFKSVFDLFSFLQAQDKRILIILDEYQYLKESMKKGEVDSYMQRIVDSLSEKVKMVFCGSYISVMKELLSEDNPLFGRFTKIMHIEELDYYDSSLFYPDFSVRDKIRFYSVFGGSPYVLSKLNYQKSLEDNIKDLLIEQDSLLRVHVENVMLKEIQKNFDIRILEVIGNGKKKYKEIADFCAQQDTGLLDKQLKTLLNMETIVKTFPINKPDDKKKVFYEIKDNLMRFYFTWIFGNDSLIFKFGKDTFFEKKIRESLNTFVSYRFEGIANQYFIRLARNGSLNDIEDFGSYWYDNKETHSNGQFDCVLKGKAGYDFYEVKFYEKPMTESECEDEEQQLQKLTGISRMKTGFICSAGFSFSNARYDLITAEDLYKSI